MMELHYIILLCPYLFSTIKHVCSVCLYLWGDSIKQTPYSALGPCRPILYSFLSSCNPYGSREVTFSRRSLLQGRGYLCMKVKCLERQKKGRGRGREERRTEGEWEKGWQRIRKRKRKGGGRNRHLCLSIFIYLQTTTSWEKEKEWGRQTTTFLVNVYFPWAGSATTSLWHRCSSN